MRDNKNSPAMEAASEELEGRSRYLSFLIQRSKSKSESEEAKEKERLEEEKEENEDLDEELMKNLKARAADMAPAMQRRAFWCAREVMKDMNKLDSKKLALALKRETCRKAEIARCTFRSGLPTTEQQWVSGKNSNFPSCN